MSVEVSCSVHSKILYVVKYVCAESDECLGNPIARVVDETLAEFIEDNFHFVFKSGEEHDDILCDPGCSVVVIVC